MNRDTDTRPEVAMAASFVLEPGDVVVVPEARQSHLVYVVRAEGGADQLTYQTRAAAATSAIAYARQRGVNAWYGDRPELGFVLLACCRERTGARDHSRESSTVSEVKR